LVRFARVPKPPLAIAAALALATGLAACGSTQAGGASGSVRIVAAENFWGSIAAQLAGSGAHVQSIVVNPDQDPHDYEPKASDARALATAQLVIVNGIGYDGWASRLLAANPVGGRAVLDAGDLLGVHEGGNPHRWYDPADVERVADAITADLVRLDPRHATDYTRRRRSFETRGLARYHALIDAIRTRYAGVPVGASESIVALLAPALGLRLITPPRFMDAIGEGAEVGARDVAAVQRQLARGEAKVWIFNSQNATPDVQRLTALARAHGIPVATVTETLAPEHASFQQWQVAQLARLERALRQATGR
jgi:zinc/manganese transport system substrate-binding protein